MRPEEKAQNYLHSPSIAPKLRLSLDQRFHFLENVNLVPKHQVMTSRRREMWQKNLTLALPWIGSSSYCSYRWPLLLA